MKYTESKTLEVKERFTKSLLKTIAAFLNDGGGKIYIGIKDDGRIIGVKDPVKEKIQIEHSINDTITPKPRYSMNLIQSDDKNILEIVVEQGYAGPYFYENKAYIRNDTSTIPLDGPNLTRLILKNKNLTYDQLDCQETSLSFEYLSERFKSVLNIQAFSNEIKTTLGLLKHGTYNHGAALLSDNGHISQSYVDIAKFRFNQDVFEDRKRLSDQSILKYFDDAVQFFNLYYQPQHIIHGIVREKVEKIPLEAFREALANAIIHRDYSINTGVQIAMFDNRIEIQSPGGLPDGLTEAMYFQGLTSITRNPVIAMVFYRLGLIEQFGTGIKRIMNSYLSYGIKPSFMIHNQQIKIILPVMHYDYKTLQTEDAIIAFLKAFPNSTRSDIEQAIEKEKSFVVRRLNELQDKGLVKVIGNGPNTTYKAI